jgi:hypothetical protein
LNKPFVVISGLPGSGKSTLGQSLAQGLGLRVLDKDAILERLFEEKGVGDIEWRRTLSRESDNILQAEATASDGAVLISHWRLPGMPLNSGTPTDWLYQLSNRIVDVHCECPADLSAERFVRRKRHPGHMDHERSHAEVLASIQAVAGFGRLQIGPRLNVDTSQSLSLDTVLRRVRQSLE